MQGLLAAAKQTRADIGALLARFQGMHAYLCSDDDGKCSPSNLFNITVATTKQRHCGRTYCRRTYVLPGGGAWCVVRGAPCACACDPCMRGEDQKRTTYRRVCACAWLCAGHRDQLGEKIYKKECNMEQ